MANKSKAKQLMQIKCLEGLFNNSSFSQRWRLEYNTTKYFENFENNPEFTDRRSLKMYVRPKNEDEEKELKEIQDYIAKQAQYDPSMEIPYLYIDQSLNVGDEFPHYTQLQSVVYGSKYEIKHQEGEVILLDFWSSKSQIYKIFMQNKQEMLIKNQEKWGGKVKIIAVCIDQEVESTVEIVSQNNWDKIIHFRLEEIKLFQIIYKDFEINIIPFAVLVDKKGLIDYQGNLQGINLEERINNLLDDTFEFQRSESDMDSEKYKLTKNFMKNKLPEYFASQYGNELKLYYRMKLFKKTLLKKNKMIKSYKYPVVFAFVDKKEIENYYKLKNFVSSSLQNIKLHCLSEQIQDLQAELKKDMEALSKIYDKFNFRSIQNKYCVQLCFQLKQGCLQFSRNDSFNQHKKLFSQNLDLVLIDRAGGEILNFVFQKLNLNELPHYIKKMSQKRIQVSQTEYQKPVCYEQVYRKYKNLFSNQLIQDLEINFNVNYDTKFKLYMKRRRVFNTKGQMMYKYYSQPVCKYVIREKDQKIFYKEVLDKLFTKFDNNDIIFRSNILKAAQIEEGKNCKSCNCELTIPYYFNYFQKEYYCLFCGDKTDPTKETFEQFAVPHNLVLVTTCDKTILNDVDEYKIGKDLQLQPNEKIEYKQGSYLCNGCYDKNQKFRYICLNCRPGPSKGYSFAFVDFCQVCLKKLVFDKDESLLKKIQQKDPQHNFNHIYLKIMPPFKGYLQY